MGTEQQMLMAINRSAAASLGWLMGWSWGHCALQASHSKKKKKTKNHIGVLIYECKSV